MKEKIKYNGNIISAIKKSRLYPAKKCITLQELETSTTK